jgi:hypothetical protein
MLKIKKIKISYIKKKIKNISYMNKREKHHKTIIAGNGNAVKVSK